MNSPKSFIVENKEHQLELNKEVLDIIENSVNPQFFLFYGKTRLGKSTTLNQLIKGNLDSRKFKNSKPFKSTNTLHSITKGCNIYGPIKASELMKRHNIKQNIKKDCDVFFCDTEGISSLDGIKKETIPGILTLLQISTISVFMVHQNCSSDDLKEITSQIQLSRCLKQIHDENNKNNEKEGFPTPLITVYISSIFTGSKEENNNNDEEDDEDKGDIDIIKKIYIESKNLEKQRILKNVNEKYPELNLNINDFDVIPGGPYINSNKEPDKDDINAELYWWSINELMDKFLFLVRTNKKKMESKDMINMIKFLFEIFQGIDTLNDEFNLEEFLKTYLTKKFEEYSQKKFMEKLELIKDDIIINFNQYLEIINDVEKAKKSLKECFDKNIDLYKKLIGDKIESFINLSVEKYQKQIKEQIDKEFQSICNNILSDDNINILIKDVVEMITTAEFKEDIDNNKVESVEDFWILMYEKNKIILDYFKDRKAGLLDNLKQNFISKINKIFSNLIKDKKEWGSFSKDILISIQKEINKYYLDLFNKCNYQEDKAIHIKKPEEVFNEIFPSLKDKYLKNISENRANEIQEKIKIIFQNEYSKIIKNKLPKWENIKLNIILNISQSIESYIYKIFNGKKFREEIVPNLGRKEAILNNIPNNIINDPLIKENKKNEVNEIIEKKVEKAVINFNKKREALPLFDESISNKIKECSLMIDNKMKEILKSFVYLEEKVIFNADTIYAFLTKDGKIFKNIGSKLNEANIKIKELCELKSKEYDSFVKKNKPEWNIIKGEKLLETDDICKNYIYKLFKNANFQDNIKSINIQNLKKTIIESPNFLEGVAPHKKNELLLEVDKIIQLTEERIFAQKNALQNWDTIKLQKLQQAIIEMNNKSKTELNTLNLNEITEKLVQHVKMIPNFFDFCKEKERKNELLEQIRISAKPIALEYLNRKNKEIQEKQEQERINNNFKKMIKIEEAKFKEAEKKLKENEKFLLEQKINFEKRQKEMNQETEKNRNEINNLRRILEEEKKRYEEEKKRLEEEKKRLEEENRRRIEEENRRRIEEENRRRIDEENRRKIEERRNYIERMAREVLNGRYGNGQARRNALGNDYNEIQNRVNEILGLPFRH